MPAPAQLDDSRHDPVWTGAIHALADLLLALVALALLLRTAWSPLLVPLLVVLASALLNF